MIYRMTAKVLLVSASAMTIVGCTAEGDTTWTTTLVNSLATILTSTIVPLILGLLFPTTA